MTRPSVLYWTGDWGSLYNSGEMTGVAASWNAITSVLTCSRSIETRSWAQYDVTLDTHSPASQSSILVTGVMIVYVISAPRERVGWNTQITLNQGGDLSTIPSMAGVSPGAWVGGDRWVPYDYPEPNSEYWNLVGNGALYAEQPALTPINLNGVLSYSSDEGGEVTFYSHFTAPVRIDLTQPIGLSWTAASFNDYDLYDFNNAYRVTSIDHAPAYTGGSSERITRVMLVGYAATPGVLSAGPWGARRRFGTTDEE